MKRFHSVAFVAHYLKDSREGLKNPSSDRSKGMGQGLPVGKRKTAAERAGASRPIPVPSDATFAL